MSTFTYTMRRIVKDGIPQQLYTGSPASVGWTNADFGVPSPAGTSPITLLLRLLMSTGTTGSNGTYDVYQAGIGLGIPQDQVDIESFEAIEEELDWDPNQQLFFLIAEPEPTKQFIDREICAPFGLYLVTGNDGKIRCVRPRHPQKFYIGDANRRLAVDIGNAIYTAILPIGVFDAEEICDNIERAFLLSVDDDLPPDLPDPLNPDLEHPTRVFECTYNVTNHKFTLKLLVKTWDGDEELSSTPTEFDLVNSTDNGWDYLGWTSRPAPVTPPEVGAQADLARGEFSGPTLTEDDMWAVRILDNMEDRITTVAFACDYDIDTKKYVSGRLYPGTPSEYEHLEDTFGPTEHRIYSRGLITGGEGSPSWVTGTQEPPTGCDPEVVPPATEVGVNADTWAKLIALTFIDRYREPPLKFRAQLKWKWNGLEVGDVVRVSYGIAGVFVDCERNKDVLEDRLFEIVELHPNFDGSLEATFLGHRYVSY